MAHEPFNLLARYQMLVGALRDPELTKGDCVVLSVILGHVDSDGEAWPGLERICEQAKISRRTAIRAIDNLEAAYYLETQKEIGKVNRYTVLPDPGDRPRRTSAICDTGWDDVDFNSPVPSMAPPSATEVTPTRAIPVTKPVPSMAPELGLELDSLNSIQGTRVEQSSLETEEQKQERLQEMKRKTREGFRAEYLATLKTHPKHARAMEREPMIRKHIADLIPLDEGRLPPLVA